MVSLFLAQAQAEVNWEWEPASRFPLPTLATKNRGSLLPFPTDHKIGAAAKALPTKGATPPWIPLRAVPRSMLRGILRGMSTARQLTSHPLIEDSTARERVREGSTGRSSGEQRKLKEADGGPCGILKRR